MAAYTEKGTGCFCYVILEKPSHLYQNGDFWSDEGCSQDFALTGSS